MDDLLALYRDTLAGHIAALEEARAAARRGDPGALAAIRHRAHQLKGSGGTYGFPQITAAAEALQAAGAVDVPHRLDALIAVLQHTRDGS